MTATLAGSATDVWTEIVVRFGDVLPAYPSTTVVPTVRIPAPALLTGDDPAEWCLQLLVAYHATMPHFFDCYGLRPYNDLRMRHLYAVKTLAALQRSALFIRQQKIRPHVWCAMSASTWRMSARAHRPSLAWVYGWKRLHSFDWLYAPSEQAVRGQRIQFVKPHLTLMRRYERMRVLLIARARKRKRKGLQLERSDVQEVVDAVLPDQLYRGLIKEARRAVRTQQANVAEALEQGAYLW